MAGERRINWGADATDARYRTEDTGDGANFVVAEDLDGGTVLLEYDSASSEWVSRGPVNMDGNAITNVSDLDVSSASIDQASITSVFTTASSDSELDNILSSVNNGEAILLANDTFSTDRTISQNNLTFVGTGQIGTEISGNWTLSSGSVVDNVDISGTITADTACVVKNSRLGSVTATNNNVGLFNLFNGSVTFESGTSQGIVDGCRNISITDNGSNVIGDNS